MDDLISRQAAIMHFVKVSKNYECGMFDLKEVTYELWQLPSAQPERKKGTWIDDRGLYKCSSCGELWPHWWASCVSMKQMRKELRYCPYCGADMREE